jgi:hypothetical protein
MRAGGSKSKHYMTGLGWEYQRGIYLRDFTRKLTNRIVSHDAVYLKVGRDQPIRSRGIFGDFLLNTFFFAITLSLLLRTCASSPYILLEIIPGARLPSLVVLSVKIRIIQVIVKY